MASLPTLKQRSEKRRRCQRKCPSPTHSDLILWPAQAAFLSASRLVKLRCSSSKAGAISLSSRLILSSVADAISRDCNVYSGSNGNFSNWSSLSHAEDADSKCVADAFCMAKNWHTVLTLAASWRDFSTATLR